MAAIASNPSACSSHPITRRTAAFWSGASTRRSSSRPPPLSHHPPGILQPDPIDPTGEEPRGRIGPLKERELEARRSPVDRQDAGTSRAVAASTLSLCISHPQARMFLSTMIRSPIRRRIIPHQSMSGAGGETSDSGFRPIHRCFFLLAAWRPVGWHFRWPTTLRKP